MSSQFQDSWSAACYKALDRPLQSQLTAAYASGGSIVCASCIAAVSGFVMFIKWWRMNHDGRRQCWRLYGWFSGLMCVGSVFGAATWASYMQFLVVFYKLESQTQMAGVSPSNGVLSSLSEQHALSTRWLTAQEITYPFEFICLTTAKLMVLDRMRDFAFNNTAAGMKRWIFGARLVLAVVVTGNLVALISHLLSAAFWKAAGDFASESAAAYAQNKTADGANFEVQNLIKAQATQNVNAVAHYCEVLVLLCIIAAFIAVGAVCARRLTATILELSHEMGASSRQLRRQILYTVTFVFAAFLLRAIYAIFFAVVSSSQNQGATCAHFILCDSTCFNVSTHILSWMLYTPEFPIITAMFSSPLSLLVALWGMTSERTLQLMRSNRFHIESIPASLQRETESFAARESGLSQGFE